VLCTVLGIAVITLNGKAVDGNAFASKVTSAIQLVGGDHTPCIRTALTDKGPNTFPNNVCCHQWSQFEDDSEILGRKGSQA
jgi:hypothetical protein